MWDPKCHKRNDKRSHQGVITEHMYQVASQHQMYLSPIDTPLAYSCMLVWLTFTVSIALVAAVSYKSGKLPTECWCAPR